MIPYEQREKGENNMKKRFCNIVLVLLLIMMLSACGNSADGNQSDDAPLEENTQSMDSPGKETEDALEEAPSSYL